MLTLPTSSLVAALECCAKKDIRFYLKGVHLECTHAGDIHLVGTDGTIMTVGRIAANDVDWTDTPQRGPWRQTIPRETIESALKAFRKLPRLTISALPNGDYALQGIAYRPVDGIYPDWRRVYPGLPVSDAPKAHFVNIDLLTKACAAVRAWHDTKAPPVIRHIIDHRGSALVTVTGDDDDCVAIVMPMRAATLTIVSPFRPGEYEAPASAA